MSIDSYRFLDFACGAARTLEVLPQALEPDTYVELPFVWPESPAKARNASKGIPPAPIVELVTKKPWLLANLYSGRIPHEEALCAKD